MSIYSFFESCDYRTGASMVKRACVMFKEQEGKSFSIYETILWLYFHIRTCVPEEDQNDDTLIAMLNLLVPLKKEGKLIDRCRFGEMIREDNDELVKEIKKARSERLLNDQEYITLYGGRTSFMSGWTLARYACARDFMYWYASDIGTEYDRYRRRGLIRYIDTHEEGKEVPPIGGCNSSWCSELSDVMNVFNVTRDELSNRAVSFLEKNTPSEIKKELDTYIIGQDEAKELLSAAVFNNYLRMAYPDKRLSKFNVLVIGPSGSGKTELVRRIRELVDVPVVLEDVSALVATPFRGRNKEELLLRLIQEASGDLELAKHGIIFCDEFDKLCKPNGVRGHDNNDMIMGQFLGMMEGAVIDTAQRTGKSSDDTDFEIDTSDILFVCMGAFEGLEDIVLKDMASDGDCSGVNAFGLKPKISGHKIMHSRDVELKHLVEYGIKPELAGRLCNLAVLDAVDRDLLLRIMKDAEDSPIKRIQKELFLDDKITLEFEDEALLSLADLASKTGTGVRALNGVLRKALEDILFNAPSMEKGTVVTVTKEMIDKAHE